MASSPASFEEKRQAATFSAVGSKVLEPDTQVISREGWYQLLTPSQKDESLNEVQVSRLPDSTPHAQIERIADETIAGYREHGITFKWAIGPMSSPDALEAALVPRATESWWFRGMAIDTDLHAPFPSHVTVERVSSSNSAVFVDVFSRAWKREDSRERMNRHAAKMIAPDSIFRLYLARVDGEPAGVAGTVIKAGYGYLIAAAVLESRRGAGAYRALVDARLGDLAKLGLPFAVTQARESTSAPILERIGFETVYRAKIYRFKTD